MLRYLYIYNIYILYCKPVSKNIIKAAHKRYKLSLSLYLSVFLPPLVDSLSQTADAATIFSIKIDAVLLHSCVRLNAHNCVRASCMCACAMYVCVCECRVCVRVSRVPALKPQRQLVSHL